MEDLSYVDKLTKERDVRTEKLPWVEKYRPKEIDHVISHKEIISSLKRFISQKTLPHLLFFGPSGSGKTSTIVCCAKEIYGQYMEWMILRLNSSNERGIDTVRTKIKSFVFNKSSIFLPEHERVDYKLVILDEIDSMTVEAQGILRQTIEKNSATTRFCLICNDIDKISVSLQSRCTLYRFAPLSPDDMRVRLHDICVLEKVKYTGKSIDAIIRMSKGDMRTAINMLQHVNSTVNGKISTLDVYKILGYSPPAVNDKIFQLLTEVMNKEITLKKSVDQLSNLITEHNITMSNLLDELRNSIVKSDYSINSKIFLIDNLARSEYYDSFNVDSRNIILIITSSFLLAGTTLE